MGTIQIDHQQLEILGKLAIAMVLGAFIGLDREAANKPAGLRTHILVAGSAALLIAIGEVTVLKQVDEVGESITRTDPIRIIEATIVGISFLGAGTIIRDRSKNHVEGLTTAASLLFTAVVGMNVAFSQWAVAIGATILILIILRLIPRIERKLHRKDKSS
jgi:putative Mg2+ transporter-C (MgtC) family protein